MDSAPVANLDDVFCGGTDLFADAGVLPPSPSPEPVAEHSDHEATLTSLAQSGSLQERINDVNRGVASLGLPNLTFSGEPADTHNTIDVIRRLMTDSRRSVEETNKVNLELRRVMAERDRLKRKVESQENELKAMDKNLCRSELLIENKKTQFERLTRQIKAENKKLHVRIRRLENMDKEYKASMNRKEKELEKMRKAVRRNVNTSNSKIKHGIKMSHTLQRPDGRRQRWNDDTTAQEDLLTHARLAYEDRLAQLEDLLAAVSEAADASDDEAGGSAAGGSLLTQVVALVAAKERKAANQAAAQATPKAAENSLQTAKINAMMSQIRTLQNDLATAKHVVGKQHELLHTKIFASPTIGEANGRNVHPASADTVAFVEERNRLVKEREMILEEEYHHRRKELGEQAKAVQQGRRQLKRAWAALDRGQGPAVSGKATPVAAAASSVVAKDGGAADDGQTSGDTPLSVLFQQLEAGGETPSEVATTAAPVTASRLPPPTPGTERLLAHMFGPRRLNWDNVSPITSTPQRSTPKKKVPRSTTRKSGKKKHVRRALMDLGGNTPGRKAAGLRSAISTPGREVVGAV